MEIEKNQRKIFLTKVTNSIIALFLILNCQSVWQISSEHNFYIYELNFIISIITPIFIILLWGIKKNNISKFLLITIIYYSYLIIYILFSVNENTLIRFVSRFAIFPFCCLLFLANSPDKYKFSLFKSYVNWTVLISSITSLLWFFASVINIISPSGTFDVVWGGNLSLTNYYNIYFSSPLQYIDWLSWGFRRNIGIFIEGPMFMLVLIFALIFIIIFDNYYKFPRWKLIIILCTLLSTFSVTGYIIGLFSISIYLFSKYRNNKIIITFFYLSMTLIVLIIPFIIKLKSSSASFSVRLDDFIAGIKAFIQSPLFGNGYENQNIIKNYMSTHRSYNMGYSNSIFSILAYGGLCLISLYFIPIFKGIWMSIKQKNYKIFTIIFAYCLLLLFVIFYSFFINFYLWAFLLFGIGRIHKYNQIQYLNTFSDKVSIEK